MDNDNHEEQPRQTPMSFSTEAPTKNESEYRGPHIHAQITSQVAQPTTQYPYQGFQYGMPLARPGAPSVVAHPLAYLGVPYASYGVQTGQTVNLGVMYPAQIFLNLLILKHLLKLLHKLLNFLILNLIYKVWLSIRIFLVKVRTSLLNISC